VDVRADRLGGFNGLICFPPLGVGPRRRTARSGEQRGSPAADLSLSQVTCALSNSREIHADVSYASLLGIVSEMKYIDWRNCDVELSGGDKE
jgi:hypothetical protein